MQMNGIINSNAENNERILSYPIILAAKKGEPEAMILVFLHEVTWQAYLHVSSVMNTEILIGASIKIYANAYELFKKIRNPSN